jgi:hypothetical protein
VFALDHFGFKSTNTIYGLGFLVTLFLTLNIIYYFFRNHSSFSQLILVGITVKLLICLTLIAVYSFFYKGDFFQFAIIFVINYVIFTIFEIRFLLQLIKNTNLNKHSSQ